MWPKHGGGLKYLRRFCVVVAFSGLLSGCRPFMEHGETTCAAARRPSLPITSIITTYYLPTSIRVTGVAPQPTHLPVSQSQCCSRVCLRFVTLTGMWSAQDEAWLLWVCCQWLVYGVGWKYLNDRLCVLPGASEQM